MARGLERRQCESQSSGLAGRLTAHMPHVDLRALALCPLPLHPVGLLSVLQRVHSSYSS
jgi:hypothetical protein